MGHPEAVGTTAKALVLTSADTATPIAAITPSIDVSKGKSTTTPDAESTEFDTVKADVKPLAMAPTTTISTPSNTSIANPSTTAPVFTTANNYTYTLARMATKTRTVKKVIIEIDFMSQQGMHRQRTIALI